MTMEPTQSVRTATVMKSKAGMLVLRIYRRD